MKKYDVIISGRRAAIITAPGYYEAAQIVRRHYSGRFPKNVRLYSIIEKEEVKK